MRSWEAPAVQKTPAPGGTGEEEALAKSAVRLSQGPVYYRLMRSIFLALILLIFGAASALADARVAPGVEELPYKEMRLKLVREIALRAKLTSAETGVETLDARVLEAVAEVPRHEFVPTVLRPFAYLNRPLPLGHGQNIANPYLIALMTHLARVGEGDVVFETGTGAGYHAAILSRLAKRVYSVEVIEPLAEKAVERLRRLEYDNVETLVGDGYYGWPSAAPFDVIIVKEAVDHIPPPLLKQLKPGGRMVIPLGPLNGVQHLTLIEKGVEGRLTRKRVLAVRFSPLQGGQRI